MTAKKSKAQITVDDDTSAADALHEAARLKAAAERARERARASTLVIVVSQEAVVQAQLRAAADEKLAQEAEAAAAEAATDARDRMESELALASAAPPLAPVKAAEKLPKAAEKPPA